MTAERKRILVCVLDWGIGHASRSIPLIRLLLKHDCEVLIAANGGAKALLQQYFPDLQYIYLPSVSIKYARGGWLGWKLMWQMPKFIASIFRENKALEAIIRTEGIDGIISDNRFGCWSKSVPSVYITHQVNLISPVFRTMLSPMLTKMHYWIIRQYGECWIPDLPGPQNGLAGRLSHPPAKGTQSLYIGLLSRFNRPAGGAANEGNYILAILSGPEPQRTILEKKILRELQKHPLKIIRGLPGHPDQAAPANVEWFNHVSDERFGQLVQGARHIICRSGYSTLMDLVKLGKTALLIPTPGQTEQEYLAEHLSRAGLFSARKQSQKIELPSERHNSNDAEHFTTSEDLLQTTVANWLAKL